MPLYSGLYAKIFAKKNRESLVSRAELTRKLSLFTFKLKLVFIFLSQIKIIYTQPLKNTDHVYKGSY
jgi:hypothetical protein